MKRSRISAIIVATTAGLIAAGSGLSAWASWNASPKPTEAKGSTGRVPAVAQPRAVMSGGRPEVAWAAPEITPSRPVTGYVVTRVHQSGSKVVCTVPVTTRTCVDRTPPAGSVSYVVRATASIWDGPDSPPSTPLAIAAAAATLAAVTTPGKETAVAPGPTAGSTSKPAAEPTTEPPAVPKAQPTVEKTSPPPATSPAAQEPPTSDAQPSASGSASEGIPQ